MELNNKGKSPLEKAQDMYLAPFLFYMRYVVLLFAFWGCLNSAQAQTATINWHRFSELESLQKQAPRKVFIDVFTDWCGWCKKMDASTFKHPVIVKLMNRYFYAVKLDAEAGDSLRYQGISFGKRNGEKRTPHDLAVKLLNGKMSYPTTVYLDETLNSLGPVPGYLDAAIMEKILVFFGENHYKTTEWKVFEKNFSGEIVKEEHGY